MPKIPRNKYDSSRDIRFRELVDENVNKRGLSPDEARIYARRTLGLPVTARERTFRQVEAGRETRDAVETLLANAPTPRPMSPRILGVLSRSFPELKLDKRELAILLEDWNKNKGAIVDTKSWPALEDALERRPEVRSKGTGKGGYIANKTRSLIGEMASDEELAA
jgi:hypothetical protein